MNNLSIDIIIPAYNAEESIEKCILSIINQKYKNVSIIVVDDKSSDQTLKKLYELKNKHPSRISVLTQEKQGPSAARNLGLKHSKADFIGFVDADDYISDEMYESMLSEVDEETDLVICGRYDIDQNDKRHIRLPNKKHHNTNIQNNEQLISLTTQFVWDKIYRKKIINKHNISFPENIYYAEDCVFLSKFKVHSRNCKIIAKPFYYYNTETNSSTTNSCNIKWLDIIDSLKEINNYFESKYLFNKYQEQLRYLAIGYYKRRIDVLSSHTNKFMQLRFLFSMHSFMNKTFPGWKEVLKKYHRFYTSKIITATYIIIPNKIKPAIFTKSKALQDYILHKNYYRLSQQLFPLKPNHYLFVSYSGSSISDSPLYIAKELTKNDSNTIYFASKNIEHDSRFCKENNLNFKIVSTSSLAYIRLLATCTYVTTNSRVPTFFNKRNNQVFVNTWHGTPLKTLGAGMRSGIRDIGRNQNQFLMSDYFLHPNIFTKEKIGNDFCMDGLYSGKYVLQGYPRNDPFFYSQEKKDHIKNKFKLSDKKIFIYMPTWRGETIGSINTETSRLELSSVLNSIDKFLPEDTILIVKPHQNLNINITDNNYKNIIPPPNFSDIYELLCISDLLITDYSSIMFDYLYAQKPIILFLYDYEKYNKERGFYIDAKDTPFPKSYNIEELISLLNDPTLNETYEQYIEKFCLPYSTSFSQQSVKEIYTNKKSNNHEKTAQKYDVYFCDPCTDNQTESDLIKLATSAKNRILVFHHADFNSRTESLISNQKEVMYPFVIVPEELNITLFDNLLIKINNKTGLFRNYVQRIYASEFNRMLPKIKFNKIYNLSKNPRFRDLSDHLS